MVDVIEPEEQEDIQSLLEQETQDGPGDLDNLPASDYDGEDD